MDSTEKECGRAISLFGRLHHSRPPDSDTCHRNLVALLQASCLTFLGMELDTQVQEIRLPQDKLIRLRALLNDWDGCKAGRKRELLLLIGFLQHASKAVRQGRTFLRWLIDLASKVERLDAFLRLNVSARSDIKWWRLLFTSHWNGTWLRGLFWRIMVTIQMAHVIYPPRN